MCFKIFFYRVSKFIWGMSLANRLIICKKLQFLVTNAILSIRIFRNQGSEKLLQSNLFGFKIQDSRLRKNFFNPTSLDSRFTAQKKLLQFNLFGIKIRDSRLRKNFFNSTSLDSRSKVQGAEKTSSIQPPWIQDPRFKAQKKLLQSNPFGFKIQDPRRRKKLLQSNL